MKMALLRAGVAAVALAGTTEAWGPDGHTTVAHIADSLLSPELQKVLKDELGATSLTNASTWCDDFDHTREGEWSEALHFINYPQERDCSFDWARDCANDWCNVGAIVNYTEQVFDPTSSLQERLIALKFVIHMTGDVHQPLHVACAKDRGGNDIHVHFDFDAQRDRRGKDHLHAVWDKDLVLQDLDELSSGQNDDFGPKGNWPLLTKSLLQRLQGEWKEHAADWEKDVASLDNAALREGLAKVASETAALSCSTAYANMDGSRIESGDLLGRDYFERAKPVIEMQLAKAGARLSQLLHDALAKTRAETMVYMV